LRFVIDQLVKVLGNLRAFSWCAAVRNYHSSPVVFAWLGDYYRLGTGLLTHDGGKFTQ